MLQTIYIDTVIFHVLYILQLRDYSITICVYLGESVHQKVKNGKIMVHVIINSGSDCDM